MATTEKMIPASKIAELLRRSDPKAYASIVLGVTQAEFEQAAARVLWAETALEIARARLAAAGEAAEDAGRQYDAAWGVKNGLPIDDGFRPSVRPKPTANGTVVLSDRDTNFGSY